MLLEFIDQKLHKRTCDRRRNGVFFNKTIQLSGIAVKNNKKIKKYVFKYCIMVVYIRK